MATEFRAPWPNHKVTVILPNPLFDDARASEASVTIKRTMTGRLITYVNSSDRVSLRLPFLLTRMKSLEVEAFIQSYQSAKWRIDLYDGSQWEAQLVGEPIIRRAVDRIGNSAIIGKESVDLTLTFSARRLS